MTHYSRSRRLVWITLLKVLSLSCTELQLRLWQIQIYFLFLCCVESHSAERFVINFERWWFLKMKQCFVLCRLQRTTALKKRNDIHGNGVPRVMGKTTKQPYKFVIYINAWLSELILTNTNWKKQLVKFTSLIFVYICTKFYFKKMTQKIK